MNHLSPHFCRQRLDQFRFLVGLARIADQSSQTHLTGTGVLADALGDVVGGVHRHHLAGHHNVNFLRLAFTNRHGKTAADHVAQYVVKYKVEVFLVGAFFFQKVDGGDHAAPGAANPRFRAAGLDAANAAITDLEDFIQFQILNRACFRRHFHNGVLGFGVQDQSRGIRLGITTDNHDFLAFSGQARHQILGGGRFADAAFPVNCTLTYCHCGILLSPDAKFLLSLGVLQQSCQIAIRIQKADLYLFLFFRLQ